MYIEEVNAETRLEETRQRFNLRPVRAELFGLLFAPLLHHLRREVRCVIEIGAGEVKHIRRLDDAHFNNEKLIVPPEQTRNPVAQYQVNLLIAQPAIALKLALEGTNAEVDFDRALNGRSKHATVLPEAEPAFQFHRPRGSVLAGTLLKLLRALDMLLKDAIAGYSAKVEIELLMNGQRFSIGQIGGGVIIFDSPVSLPSDRGELILTIDGHPRRWRVQLHSNGHPERVIHADFFDIPAAD